MFFLILYLIISLHMYWICISAYTKSTFQTLKHFTGLYRCIIFLGIWTATSKVLKIFKHIFNSLIFSFRCVLFFILCFKFQSFWYKINKILTCVLDPKFTNLFRWLHHFFIYLSNILLDIIINIIWIKRSF